MDPIFQSDEQFRNEFHSRGVVLMAQLIGFSGALSEYGVAVTTGFGGDVEGGFRSSVQMPVEQSNDLRDVIGDDTVCFRVFRDRDH